MMNLNTAMVAPTRRMDDDELAEADAAIVAAITQGPARLRLLEERLALLRETLDRRRAREDKLMHGMGADARWGF